MTDPKNKPNPKSLRSLEDLTGAYERLYDGRENGSIDSTRAAGMNTTLKGIKALRFDIPLKLYSIRVNAEIRKVQVPVPQHLLGPGETI